MRSLADILSNLVQATETDKLSWESSGSVYSTTLPNGFKVSVCQWTDEDSDISGVTTRLTKDDHLIDRVVADQFNSNYTLANELLDTAMRSAHNVNDVIDDIENMLSAMKPKR